MSGKLPNEQSAEPQVSPWSLGAHEHGDHKLRFVGVSRVEHEVSKAARDPDHPLLRFAGVPHGESSLAY